MKLYTVSGHSLLFYSSNVYSETEEHIYSSLESFVKDCEALNISIYKKD